MTTINTNTLIILAIALGVCCFWLGYMVGCWTIKETMRRHYQYIIDGIALQWWSARPYASKLIKELRGWK